MIYFIQANVNGPIKIGKSVDSQQRIKTHQCSHYEELHIIQEVPGYTEREQEIKNALAKYKLRGEWYQPVPEVLEYIRTAKYAEYEVSDGKAYAILCRSNESSKTESCPFCGKRHVHGVGDGHRVAHCTEGEEEAFAEDGTRLNRRDGYVIRTRNKGEKSLYA